MPLHQHTGDRVNFVLVTALVLLAPLFRSGKTPLAVGLLCVLAIVGLAWVLLRGRPLGLNRGALWLLTALVALPLVQWLPIPGLGRDMLPGQADYFAVQSLAGVHLENASLAAIPRDTLLGGLVVLLPVGVFLMTQTLSLNQLRTVLRVVFAMVIFQAVFGLMQFGGGPQSPLYLGMEFTHWGSAVGTYTSRNNYVGFLYLCLMVSMALFMTIVGRNNRALVNRHKGLRGKLEYWATSDGHLAIFYGALSLLLILGIVFSRSRAGIGLTMLGVVLIAALLARRIGGSDSIGLVGRVVAIGLAVAVAIGLGPVLDRFSAQDPVEDGRWTIFAGVIQGIRDFFPLGSGVGSLVSTYPPYRDPSRAMYTLNNAHNSYLEWAYTGGLVAMVLIAAFLLLYFLRWRKVWKPGGWGEFRYIQVGAGVGMLLMGLHELVDYNLFVPANMVYFAFFAGLFFYDYTEPVRKKRQSLDEMFPHTRKSERSPESGLTSPMGAVATAGSDAGIGTTPVEDPWGARPETPAGERKDTTPAPAPARGPAWNPFMAEDDDETTEAGRIEGGRPEERGWKDEDVGQEAGGPVLAEERDDDDFPARNPGDPDSGNTPPGPEPGPEPDDEPEPPRPPRNPFEG